MNKFEQAKELLRTTDLTNNQIRIKLRCRGQLVTDALKELGSTFAKDRKRRMYRASKLGDKNPMLGKTREQHPRYKKYVSDAKGYLLVEKPKWYTGRKGSRHIFLHTAVYCYYNKMTEVPAGFVIHHCDQNKLNNNLSNLVMMSMAEHAALHQLIGGATTISKESTLKWVEARRTGNSYDIV